MAQSYTRQSTFADGDTITAALFNDEYNQLVNAFTYSSSSASSTGHRHDGTAGHGGNIHTIGDLDFLNKIVVDDTNNRWGFFVEVSSAAVEQIRLSDGVLAPVTDSDVDLGTSSLYWKDAYIDSITTTGNVSVGGNLTVTGNATISGNLTFGDAATDTVAFSADVASNLLPSADNTYDIGASGSEWKDLYVDGIAYLDGINFNGTAITATAAELNIMDGVTATAAEINALDGITSTVTELNIVDGDTSATSTTLADADRVVVNDAGTMVQVALTDFETYFESALDTLSNVTTVGALNAGSITSGFGAIDNGSSAITTTGTVTYGSLSDGAITITAFVDEDNMASDSATLVPTQQSVKAYVDSQVTAQDLDFQGDSGGALSIDLDSETMTIAGGTGIDTTGATNTLTVAIDSTVATLTGSQTLTNKTLTSPVINTGVSGTAILDEDDMSSDSATQLATQQSIKAYVDAQILTEDTLAEMNDVNITTPADASLLFYDTTTSKWIDNVVSGDITIADTGVATIQANSVALSTDTTGDYVSTITAGTGLTSTGATSGEGIAHSLSVDASQTQITAVGTISTGTWQGTAIADAYVADNLTISGGTVDNSVIGGTTAAAGTFTTLTANTSITGTLATAAQTNVTSLGTLSSLTVSGDLTVDTSTLKVDSTNNRVGVGNASPDVSLDVGSVTDAIHVPSGTTAQRPASPAAGYFRYNTTTGDFEGYTDAWGAIAGAGGTAPVVDTMTGDGSDTTLTLTSAPVNENATVVTIDGVVQHKDTYSVSSNTLTFSEAPPNGTAVECITWVNTTVNSALLMQDADGDTQIQVEESADEDKIRFDTGGTERMIIDSTGVGIGTASPATKFDVITGSTGGFKLDDEATAGGVKITTYQGSTNSNVRNINFDVQNFIVSTGAPSGTSVSEALRVDNSGNVGIGETSPAPRLHVTDSDSSTDLTDANNIASFERAGNARVVIATNTGNTGSLEFGDSGGARQGRVSYAHSDDSLALFTAGSERARINSSGKVGIGTTSPSAELDITGTGEDISVRINAPTGYDAELKFANNGSTAFTLGHDDATDNFVIGTANVDTNQRFVIDSSGNVGIGTASPTEALSISSSDGLVSATSTTAKTSGVLTGGYVIYSADGSGPGAGNRAGIQSYATNGVGSQYDLRFYTSDGVTNFNEAMRIDSTGNVGIGTTSPANKFHVEGDTNGGVQIEIDNPNNGNASYAGLYLNGQGNNFFLKNWGDQVSGKSNVTEFVSTASGSQFVFSTVDTERMRITDDGKVYINRTSHYITAADQLAVTGRIAATSDGSSSGAFNRGTDTGTIIQLLYNGSGKGSITTDGSNVAYNTSSDARLKNVLGDAKGLDIVNQLNPVNFEWKETGDIQDGLIAQEVEPLIPESVSTNEQTGFYEMDYSKLVTPLIKAVQEQQEQIEELKQQINELRGN